MFSPRIFAAFALLAAAAAVPLSDKPDIPHPVTTILNDDVDDFTSWFRGPWDSLFSSVWKLIPSFTDIGPRIIAEKDKFQIVVNVKNYKKDDLTVKLKGDFIFVQGAHEAKHDNKDMFASQFFHTYSLPTNASADDVTAKLYSDGFLVVTAPLNGPFDNESVDKEVNILETGSPYNEEKTGTTDKTNVAEKSTTIQPITTKDEDKKEPTTSSDREEATVKYNIIPHENEVQP